MSLLGDIAKSYRRPRQVLRQHLARSIGEEQILFYVMLFCFLSFVAKLPEMAQRVHLGGSNSPPLAALAGSQFVASVFFAPLFLYGVAALSHVVLKPLKGKATWREARLALFWSALVCVPLVLALGIATIILPSGLVLLLASLTGLVFLWQWGSCLYEVEFAG